MKRKEVNYILVILLGIIVGFMIYFIGIYRERDDLSDKISVLLLVVLISTVIFTGFSLVVTGIYEKAVGFDRREVVIDESRLVSLNTAFETGGNLFLGSGSFEGEVKYIYIVEKSRGYDIKTKSTDDVYLREGTENPKIITYKSEVKNEWVKTITPVYSERYYVFEVPEGSVTRDIDISF